MSESKFQEAVAYVCLEHELMLPIRFARDVMACGFRCVSRVALFCEGVLMGENHVSELDELKARRRACGLTQKELAASCCVSQRVVANWESGITSIPSDKLGVYRAAIVLAEERFRDCNSVLTARRQMSLRGWTVSELADEADVPRATVARFLRGQNVGYLAADKIRDRLAAPV